MQARQPSHDVCIAEDRFFGTLLRLRFFNSSCAVVRIDRIEIGRHLLQNPGARAGRQIQLARRPTQRRCEPVHRHPLVR